MRLILTQMTLKNGCQFQTFPTGWDQRHTCHTIHHTQCKQTIHVHNRDIYGIFRCCHVNPWNKQAIKSCCQQAKTVTLQKNSSCWHENCIYHFKTCFFFFPQLPLALCSSLLLSWSFRAQEDLNELFKEQEKFQLILFFFLQICYFNFYLFILFLAVLGLCCCKKTFSSCDDWASHFSDFSCCRAWALGHKLQQLQYMGLVAPQHVESPLARNWTHIPCTGRQILNHCTIRETLQIIFDYFYFHRNLLLKVAILRSNARRRAVLRTEDLLIELLSFQSWIYYLIFPISKSLGFESIHSAFFWTQLEGLLLKFVSRITEKVQLIAMGWSL